jgi:RimJ/RimL family protein N-acetyltransferase
LSNHTAIEIAIRPWAEDDFPLLHRLLGDPAMTEHLGGPESESQLRDRHQRYCALSDAGGAMMYAIGVGPEKVAAGSVGYWPREWRNEDVWETGWSVLPEFQGQGVATRATALVIEIARADGSRRFIHAYPSVDNPASNAICRKLRFELLGDVEFEYPKGQFMRCNDWRLDLAAAGSETTLG